LLLARFTLKWTSLKILRQNFALPKRKLMAWKTELKNGQHKIMKLNIKIIKIIREI
jgi:hypothetical protein